MSARQLCADLERLGVRLAAVGGRLRVTAPVGVVTPDLRLRLHEGRDELLAALPHYHWRVSMADGHVLEVYCLPEITAAEIQQRYPDAAFVEPAAPASPRRVTTAESAELAALIAMIYSTAAEAERAEALTLALAEPDSALACYRALARACGAAGCGGSVSTTQA